MTIKLTLLFGIILFAGSKLLQAQQITNTVSGFKYELTFDIGDIPIPQEKGSYAKKLRIYDQRNNDLIYEEINYGIEQETNDNDLFQNKNAQIVEDHEKKTREIQHEV